jgi:hypothetical protein
MENTYDPIKAKELSIKKWECVINNFKGKVCYDEEELLKEFPELVYMRNYCPYCEEFLKDTKTSFTCEGCPVTIKIEKPNPDEKQYLDCGDEQHPYYIWIDSINSTFEEQLKTAKKVLKLIKAIPITTEEKVVDIK